MSEMDWFLQEDNKLMLEETKEGQILLKTILDQ